MNKTPLFQEDTRELLGFILHDAAGWEAQTIFGYSISRAKSKSEAEKIVHESGSEYLKGVWHYLDKDDEQWYPCVIKKAYEHQVTVARTNEMGYQDPSDYKLVTIDDPAETNLIKSS